MLTKLILGLALSGSLPTIHQTQVMVHKNYAIMHNTYWIHHSAIRSLKDVPVSRVVYFEVTQDAITAIVDSSDVYKRQSYTLHRYNYNTQERLVLWMYDIDEYPSILDKLQE